jgi:hypothetical protein
MSTVRRIVFVICAASGVAMGTASTGSAQDASALIAIAQQHPGQWVDPHNISDELVHGPYVVDPNWPKPLSNLPGHEGWTWGAVQGVFAQNPDRIFVAMRGELPDISNLSPQIVELETDDGRTVRLQVPGVGMYARNASVGPYASPGEATDQFMGEEGVDYRWHHVIMVFDGDGNMIEDWTQWDSLFKPADPKVLSQGRVHKILISPYDPEKRVWAIDDDHQVIRIFSNDGKELLQTIGTYDTTTEKNARMTGWRGTPSLTQKTGPADETFGRQTDIAWLPDGSFFVSDGYEETRVMKFDTDGNFLMSWGQMGNAGTERRPGYFNVVHGIAIDDQRRVYVNDRSNRRIQVFDENGKFLSEWYLGDGPAATYHIYMTADQHLWASDGHGNFKFYEFDLTGRLLQTWGTMTPAPGGLWGTHQFSVDQENNLYTAEVWGGRPQKFMPRPGADPSVLIGQPVRAAWTE